MKNSDFPTTHESVSNFLKLMNEKWVPEEHPDFKALNADGLKNEVKMSLCSHQTHAKSKHKMPDGRIMEIPNFCRLCPKCFEMEAKKHLSNFNETSRKALELKPNGEWRMKIVQKNTAQSASLKKRISRNEDGMHIAIDSTDHLGKEEIWSFVDSYDNDTYGNKANPDTINWDAINRQNKTTGSKVSRGSGLQLPPKDVQKDTEKLMIPGIVIKDKSQENTIEEIMRDTNLLELATDTKNAQHLIILQFQYILQELEKEGYQDIIVRNTYYNMSEEKLLKDWNGNVNRCMSLYDAIDNNLSADMDTLEMVKRFYTVQKEEELAA